MVKYTIIIPVYNCESYLKACVQSVLIQSVKDYEIILVNDGSSDSSGIMCNTLAAQYSCVRSFHKENGGAASARNLGLQEARGQYILFLDGDDTLDASALESIDTLLVDQAQDFIIFGMSFDYYRGGKLSYSERLSCAHSGSYDVQEVLVNHWDFFADNALSSACNKVFSAQIIGSYHLRFEQTMTLYEDYDFVLRYLMYVHTVFFIDKPLYRYRHDLEHPHLNGRVQNLASLRANLSRLMQTCICLSETKHLSKPESSLLDNSASLYLQMLSLHLTMNAYSVRELEQRLPAYCSDPSFRSMMQQGAILSKFEQELLRDIDVGKFSKIKWEFQKRRIISAVKRRIKKLLKR